MNPFSLSIAELESRARSIRRRIIVLNAESPAAIPAPIFRRLNCSPPSTSAF